MYLLFLACQSWHGAAALAAHKIAEAKRRRSRSNANLLLAIAGWRWCSNRWQQVSTHTHTEREREQCGQLPGAAAHGRSSRQGAKGMLHNCQERCKKKNNVALPLPTSPIEGEGENQWERERGIGVNWIGLVVVIVYLVVVVVGKWILAWKRNKIKRTGKRFLFLHFPSHRWHN